MIKILKKINHELLGREEIIAVAASQISYEDVKKNLSEQLKKPAELIVVKKVMPRFGRHEVEITAYVYSSEDFMKKFEPVTKQKKETIKMSTASAV